VERARVVRRLTHQGASDVTFVMRGGRSMTVANYYQEATGRPLQYPTLLCVEVISFSSFFLLFLLSFFFFFFIYLLYGRKLTTMLEGRPRRLDPS
jgi:hypothetical protein